MWLSKIVSRSIPFRHFGLLLQKEYATFLIRTAALFPGCVEDTSPKVDKSSIHSGKVQAREPRHGVSNIHFSPRQPEVPPLHSTPHDFTATPVLTTEQCTTYTVGRLRHRPDETSSPDLLRNLPRNRETSMFLLLPTTRKRPSFQLRSLIHNKVVYLFIYKGEQCCTPFTFQR